jgi:hypothetical protein
MRLIEISASRIETYEVGAAFLTFLAYPGGKEDETARGWFSDVLCREALCAMALSDPEWSRQKQLIKPAYLLLDDKQADRYLKKGLGEIRNRLQAARMVRPFFQRAQTGDWPALVPGIKHWSKSEVMNFMAIEGPINDPKNIDHRSIKPSLPVLHLAAALEHAVTKAEEEGIDKFSHLDVLLRPGLATAIIDYARLVEPLLPKISTFTIDPEKVILLRLG